MFIHLDHGFSFVHFRDQALRNSAAVCADLQALGLLISEGKFQLSARTILEWTGFVWDTTCFHLFVTDKKIAKVLALGSIIVRNHWSCSN